jgi:isopentenyl phosphate kinase
MSELIFLKLGGSLITEKEKVATPRLKALARLASEIRAAQTQNPQLQVLLGHGSGSYGHVPAKKYGTRAGVHTEDEWNGFVEVWQQAAALDHIVMAALRAADSRAMAFPPSASVSAADGMLTAWDLEPIRAALQAGLLPVVYGDVVFDSVRGGTILSTEDLFAHLAKELKPARILLAGDEDGIFSDFPTRTQLVERITPGSYATFPSALGSAAGDDVTGGMAGKVQSMLALVTAMPDCAVSIFSGLMPANVQRALAGEQLGTTISAT